MIKVQIFSRISWMTSFMRSSKRGRQVPTMQPFGCWLQLFHILHISALLLFQCILYYAQNVCYSGTHWAYGLIPLFLSIISEFMIRLRRRLRSVVCPWLQARQAPRLGHIFIKLSYQLLDSVAQNTCAINMLLIYIIYNYNWSLLWR